MQQHQPITVSLDRLGLASFLPGLPQQAHPEHATTVCQCQSPAPCWDHPDDRPLLAPKPAWNAPHPDSPVGRLAARPEPGGVWLEVECRERMAKLTDTDLRMVIERAQAELDRRGVTR